MDWNGGEIVGVGVRYIFLKVYCNSKLKCIDCFVL